MKEKTKNFDRYIKVITALKQRGWNFTYMAKAVGVGNSAICNFINYQNNSPRIKKWIKDELGITL